LRAAGACVVFTSHRWAEIRSIADRITIFRGGKDVGTFTEIDEGEAVRLMTGRRVEALYPERPALPNAPCIALDAQSLSGPNVRGVSFSLHAGEVLGIGGLAGHGHRELFRMLFGDAHASGGQLTVRGKPRKFHSPRAAIGAGIALVPEDRKTEGLLLRMSVRDNATLVILKKLTRFGVLKPAMERKAAQSVVESLRVRTAGIGQAVGALSGGNQQKVLLGRWLLAECQILLLYDVTRGVDVATKHEIYELVLKLATEGHAIVFYSSDAEELAHLCHRVLDARGCRGRRTTGARDHRGRHRLRRRPRPSRRLRQAPCPHRKPCSCPAAPAVAAPPMRWCRMSASCSSSGCSPPASSAIARSSW
jgi:ribose transport system ATP-binding protein